MKKTILSLIAVIGALSVVNVAMSQTASQPAPTSAVTTGNAAAKAPEDAHKKHKKHKKKPDTDTPPADAPPAK